MVYQLPGSMKKKLLLIIVLFSAATLTAQQISFDAMAGKEIHWNKNSNNPHINSQIESDMGFSLQFTIDQLTIGNWPFGYGIGYHSFSGDYYNETGAIGCGAITNIMYQKQLISFVVYPLSIVNKNFSLKAGIEGSSLLNETIKGTSEIWNMSQGITYYPIEDGLRELNKQYNIGLNISAGYNIALYKGLGISPFISTYIGFVPVIEEYERSFYPVRLFLGLSLYWEN